jgi:hypothetical protein
MNNALADSNIIARSTNNGLMMRAGGIARNNAMGRCPIAIGMGDQGQMLIPGTKAHIINNVLSEGHSGWFGVYDPDITVGLTSYDSPIIWCLRIYNGQNADSRITGNTLAGRAPLSTDNSWVPHVPALSIDDISTEILLPAEDKQLGRAFGVIEDNKIYKIESETQGTDQGYVDPTRTFGRYVRERIINTGVLSELNSNGFTNLTTLDAADDFDNMMNLAKSRKLNKWDARVSAIALCDWINEGFEVGSI